MTSPSIRRSGGAPAVMCMSLAPFSTIALRSWWRFTRRSAPCVICSLLPSVRHRHAEDFLRRRDALEHLHDARHAKGHHALLDRGLLELCGRRSLEDHLLEAVGEAHDLVERNASLVTR